MVSNFADVVSDSHNTLRYFQVSLIKEVWVEITEDDLLFDGKVEINSEIKRIETNLRGCYSVLFAPWYLISPVQCSNNVLALYKVYR